MIEVLKQALEDICGAKLCESNSMSSRQEMLRLMDSSITSLRQAIAELESQEPFAWAEFDGEGGYHLMLYENNETYAEDWNKRNPNHIGWVEPIYKHPPQRTWVGLTKEDKDLIEDLCEMMIGDAAFSTIDAILKGKNT